MAVSDISLTSGMRNNLLALQDTNKLINRTQDRLSTGKKVNTALDNPTNFFAAQAHNSRAADLSSRKDSMSEAVQAVKAADAGIKGITALIEAAKGVASAALATQSTDDRSNYANTFNTIMSQVDQLAKDSGYRGTNFLAKEDLTVEFAPKTGDSTLQIKGFDASANGLSMTTVDSAAGAWDTDGIKDTAQELEDALDTLRAESSKLSANLSVVTTRQDFTDTMINTLTIGADNLTLADMNEEGANMLMLQTRQNLGISSLSMASQAAQAVLRLF
jgi:flagellin-like hook-associated protein FlgL